MKSFLRSADRTGTLFSPVIVRRIAGIPILILVSTLLAGCATMIHGSRQTIYVNSDPPGARIMVDSIYRGLTPDTLRLRRIGHPPKSKTLPVKKGYVIKLEKDGFESYQDTIKRHLDPAFFLNLSQLPYFFVGMTVDGADGANFQLRPKEYYVRLQGLATSINEIKQDKQEIPMVIPPCRWSISPAIQIMSLNSQYLYNIEFSHIFTMAGLSLSFYDSPHSTFRLGYARSMTVQRSIDMVTQFREFPYETFNSTLYENWRTDSFRLDWLLRFNGQSKEKLSAFEITLGIASSHVYLKRWLDPEAIESNLYLTDKKTPYETDVEIDVGLRHSRSKGPFEYWYESSLYLSTFDGGFFILEFGSYDVQFGFRFGAGIGYRFERKRDQSLFAP